MFGNLSWSSSEKQLVYIAEKKQAKTTSYFDSKYQTKDQDGTAEGKDEPIKVVTQSYLVVQCELTADVQAE